jgi:hypothetical protein
MDEWGKYRLLEQEDKIVGEPDPPMLVVKDGFVGKIEEAVITPEETILTRIDGKTFPLSMISFRAMPFSPGPGLPECLQRFYPRLCDNFNFLPDVNNAMLEKIVEMIKLAERGTELFDIVMKEIVVLRDAEKEVRQRKPWYEGALGVSLLRAFDARVTGYSCDGCTLSFEKPDIELMGMDCPADFLNLDENHELFVKYDDFIHFPFELKKRLEQSPLNIPLTAVLYDFSNDPTTLGSKKRYAQVWPSQEYWYKGLRSQKREEMAAIILSAMLIPVNEAAELFRVSADDVNEIIQNSNIPRLGNKVSIEDLLTATFDFIKKEVPGSAMYCEGVPYLAADSRVYNVPDLRAADSGLIKIYYDELHDEYMGTAQSYYSDYFAKSGEEINGEYLSKILEHYARLYAGHWAGKACGGTMY